MNGISSVANAGLSQTQMRFQVAAVSKHQAVMTGIGSAALELIQNAVVDSGVGGNIDIRA